MAETSSSSVQRVIAQAKETATSLGQSGASCLYMILNVRVYRKYVATRQLNGQSSVQKSLEYYVDSLTSVTRVIYIYGSIIYFSFFFSFVYLVLIAIDRIIF